MSRSGPRTLVLYCFWKSATISLSAVEEDMEGVTKRFPATPALLTMMLIVRSPDCACAKWDRVAATRAAGPVGEDTVRWTDGQLGQWWEVSRKRRTVSTNGVCFDVVG